MQNPISLTAASLALSALPVIGQTNAASNVFVDSDWIVEVGAFWAGVDSEVRVDGANGEIGTEIDFENDLGLSDRELLFNVGVSYHGIEKWVFMVDWFDLQRSSSGTIDKYIEWDNTLLPVGAEVQGYFNIQVVRLFAGYTVWQNEKNEIGLGFGIHGTGVQAGLAAEGSVGGGYFELDSEVDTGLVLPLPDFGIWGYHAFSENLVGAARIEVFALDLGEYSGGLYSISASLRYKATDWLSVGLGYNFFKINANVNRALWNGRFEFIYYGPRVFTIFRF
ncbi:MAG: hypothetical protein DRP71_06030 [Verrucomicrobia bacterium]|nr:MAG: hypothetical protein DRP71_06030 [Verrucomicrobiota bacterium]